MSWNKYGSPYDPNYSGRMMHPQEREEMARREREQEQHRLRGCGDPNCAMCNPQTARFGGSSSRNVGRSTSFNDAVMDYLRFPSSDPYLTDSRSTSSGSNPPAAYIKAREGVEKWLSKAPDQAFDDIAGNAEALEQLRDAIEAPVKHKALYDAYGMRMPKGAMLSGPPGCGKTMFARAAASEMKRLYAGSKGFEFISISGSELQAMFVGKTEADIKAIFTFAREYKEWHGHPLLVFMDEAEVLLPDRTGRVRRVAPWEESQVATFLAEMDGMQESGAFVLLATNRPEVIDQAVLRDGRCEFKITVKRPDAAAIEVILRKNFAGILIGEDTHEQLVFAAVEALFDPHKVIADGQAIGLNLKDGKVREFAHRHFLLEHIVSGAMAASIPGRAKRYAFARDKERGEAKGVTVSDVLRAVNDLFEENKALDHSFALAEFKRELEAEARAAIEAEK